MWIQFIRSLAHNTLISHLTSPDSFPLTLDSWAERLFSSSQTIPDTEKYCLTFSGKKKTVKGVFYNGYLEINYVNSGGNCCSLQQATDRIKVRQHSRLDRAGTGRSHYTDTIASLLSGISLHSLGCSGLSQPNKHCYWWAISQVWNTTIPCLNTPEDRPGVKG